MEELCYANDFLNRGVCLIVEYDQFRSDMGLSSRKGSEVDLKACNELFGKMGFDVYIQKNLPYVELIKVRRPSSTRQKVLSKNLKSFAL